MTTHAHYLCGCVEDVSVCRRSFHNTGLFSNDSILQPFSVFSISSELKYNYFIDSQNVVFIRVNKRDVRPQFLAMPGCSRYVVAVVHVGHAVPTTDCHRANALRGGCTRWDSDWKR